MRVKNINIIVVIGALLVFISQSLSAVPCMTMSSSLGMAGPMQLNMQLDMQVLGGVDHSAHMTMDMASTDGNCCSGGENCTMLSCLSPSIMVNSAPFFSVAASRLFNSHYTVSYLIPDFPSLYRPPISR
jgi:hypothetical protein